jgi:MFS family permease
MVQHTRLRPRRASVERERAADLSTDAARPDVPLVTPPFVRLVIGHFLQALGYASLLLLPVYLSRLGASRAYIGSVMATAAFSGLLLRPLIGWSLDSMGRKPTVIAGTIALVIGMELIGFVDRLGPLVFAAMSVVGIGLACLFTSYYTFAADLVPAARRTEGIALFGISGLLPLLVTPIAEQLGIAGADLRWFFPGVGVAIALSLVAVVPLREPPRPAETKRLELGFVIDTLRRRALWPVWFAESAFSAMVAMFMTFATVTAERRGVAHPASLWFSYAVGAIGVRVFGARLPDRVGPSKLVAPALATFAVAALVTAHVHSLSGFLLCALLAGLGHGYGFPVLTSLAVTRTPERVRGSALALFTALWGVSELVASPSFGLIGDRYGDRAMFVAAATLDLGAVALWAALERVYGKQP